jgi:hypothetical protein
MNKELIVTPEQYSQGYLVFLEGSKPYTLIRKLPDGNYLVTEPD